MILQRKKLPQLPLGRMPGELTTLCMLLACTYNVHTGAVLASPSHRLPQHSYTNYNCFGTISQGGKPPRISCKLDSGRTTLNISSKAQTWGRSCHSLPTAKEVALGGWDHDNPHVVRKKLLNFTAQTWGRSCHCLPTAEEVALGGCDHDSPHVIREISCILTAQTWGRSCHNSLPPDEEAICLGGHHDNPHLNIY